MPGTYEVLGICLYYVLVITHKSIGKAIPSAKAAPAATFRRAWEPNQLDKTTYG